MEFSIVTTVLNVPFMPWRPDVIIAAFESWGMELRSRTGFSVRPIAEGFREKMDFVITPSEEPIPRNGAYRPAAQDPVRVGEEFYFESSQPKRPSHEWIS